MTSQTFVLICYGCKSYFELAFFPILGTCEGENFFTVAMNTNISLLAKLLEESSADAVSLNQDCRSSCSKFLYSSLY